MAERKAKTGKAAAAADDTEVEQDPGASGAEAETGQGGTAGYDLSEQNHQASLDAAEAAAGSIEFDSRSLIWDLRDALLGQFKHRPRPWSGLSEGEQRDVAASFEHAAAELVRKVVETVAANGKVPVRVLLTKVTLGDDIVISGKVKTLSADEEDEAVGLLHTARGHHVMLTVASKDDYAQGQREPETQPDQNALEFEAGAPPADDSDLAGASALPALIETGLIVDGVTFRVNLKTGMIEALPEGGDAESTEDWCDERTATSEELAAERNRSADFPEQEGGES